MKQTKLRVALSPSLAVAMLFTGTCVLSSLPAMAKGLATQSRRSTELSAQSAPTPSIASPDSIAEVPADHWAYRGLDKLRKAGIMEGSPNSCARLLTRSAFASVIVRLMDKLPVASPPGPPTKPQCEMIAMVAKFRTLYQVATLRRLTEEFRTELKLQGASIETLNQKLRVLEDIPAIKTELKLQNALANAGFHSGQISLMTRRQ